MQDRCDSLLQRLAALEAQSQRLDAFARAVAHDLKGPLCHISGYALYLRDVHRALPDANLRECLEMMHWQAKKTLALVDELLLWAGIDRDEVNTAIVGMCNPGHMRANMEGGENEPPLVEELVGELHRRFDELARA